MFWKKDEAINSRIGRYFDQCDQFAGLFERAVNVYLETGSGPDFEFAVEEAHEAESAADDLRRDIEMALYGKSLLPESRGDLLGLLEAYDQIPTAAEMVLFDLLCQGTRIPEDLAPLFRDLIEKNLEAYYLLRKTVDALMNNPRATLYAVKEVDARESESDRLERKIMRTVFSQDMDKADKLELKSLVCQIGRISDLAEHVSDRVGIIAIKRQI